VLFALWNGEEKGLLGSGHCVDQSPSYPLAETIAALSVDMVDVGDGAGLVFSGGT
jgi:Zn-dependent M28 family amino/carboxypeptidase